MAFSKIRVSVAFALAILCSAVASANTDGLKPQAKTDEKGNTVFTVIVDGLPLTSDEVFETSLKYMHNEYKTARYSEIEHYGDKGIIVGKSTLNSFFTSNGLAKSEVFSADYYLRIDAKDNKARVQVIFTNYRVLKLSDSSNKEELEVNISSVAPFKDGKDNKRYTKAYGKLQEYVAEVLNSVSQKLKSATPSPVVDEW